MSDFERKIEVLKVWYAIFTTIMDTPEELKADMDKLRKLRERLRIEAPGLEAEIQRDRN